MERNTLEVSTPTNRKDHPERSGFFLSIPSQIRGFGKFVWHFCHTPQTILSQGPGLLLFGRCQRNSIQRRVGEILSQIFNKLNLVIHISVLSLYPKPIYMTHLLTLTKDLIGKKVRVIEMVDEPFPVPSGTIGTIYSVGFDVICVEWENGRNIGLIYDIDTYEILD